MFAPSFLPPLPEILIQVKSHIPYTSNVRSSNKGTCTPRGTHDHQINTLCLPGARFKIWEEKVKCFTGNWNAVLAERRRSVSSGSERPHCVALGPPPRPARPRRHLCHSVQMPHCSASALPFTSNFNDITKHQFSFLSMSAACQQF